MPGCQSQHEYVDWFAFQQVGTQICHSSTLVLAREKDKKQKVIKMFEVTLYVKSLKANIL